MENKTATFKIIEYRCQALKNTLGLIDHYFLVIDDKEYHLGFYTPGKVLPKDSTKGYHIVSKRKVCETCYNKIIADLNYKEDIRLIRYFPFLNCETLCTGFSVQSLALLTLPCVGFLIVKGKILYVIILVLLTLIVILVYSKYTFSRTKYSRCKHLP